MTLPSAWAWTPSSPIGFHDNSWQTINIAYGYNDPVGPADIFEEYRPVVPVQYYASDATFISFFGTSGLTNVDNAFGIVNGAMCGLTNTPIFLYSSTSGVTLSASGVTGGIALSLGASNNLERYSSTLSEFPPNSQEVNYTAQTLGLYDMKSVILHEAVLELGLADPDRYVWSLHDRLPNPLQLKNPKCPQDVEYLVVQRNFDVTQNYPYSPYINGTLYYFEILENCGNGGVPYSAISESFSADPFSSIDTAVASGGLLGDTLGFGQFYTGLTGDDMAGLKYLLSSNNINWEATAPSGGQLFTINTNYSTPQVFPGTTATNGATGTNGTTGFYYYDGTYGYGDIAAFLAFAHTNNQAALQAAYPGVVVSSVSTTWVLASNQTYSSYYKPAPAGSVYGSPPQLVLVTNYTPYWQFLYSYTFANVFTNHFSTNTVALRQTTSTTAPAGSPYGSAVFTNITTVKIPHQVSGDFFVMPPFYGGVCPLDIVSPGIATVVATTNLLTAASTNVVNPLIAGSTGTNFSSSVSQVTFFTNYSYVTLPVTCGTAASVPGLRRGIERVQFIRANYDSLLGQFFQPLTNNYTMVLISNSQPVTEYYQRVVTQPDFLFQAQDLTVPSANFPYGVDWTITTPNFDTSAVATQLAGPGAIVPGATLVFNKNEANLFVNGSLNVYGIGTNAFLNIDTQLPDLIWAAFDDTTNLPIVYPSTLNISNLMNQLVLQVSPSAVPAGAVGAPYSVMFSATGGQSPYVWSAPNLSTLVPGLSFDPGSATISGTPTTTGVFNFTLQLTDSVNRIISLNYSITIQ